MGHPAVAEAAVVAVAHEKEMAGTTPGRCGAQARPFATRRVTHFLAGSFAKWWLPDASCPRTDSTHVAGKFLKKLLRTVPRLFANAFYSQIAQFLTTLSL